MDYNLLNKARIHRSTSKYINKIGKVLPYSRMPTNKYRKNDGGRKSSMDTKTGR